MLDNSIRGGQIFLHQIRMFKQIAGSAISISILIGLGIAALLNLERFEAIEWDPSLTYWWGWVIDKVDNITPNIGKNYTQMKINIATGFGKVQQIPIKQFMRIQHYIIHGDRL